MLVNQKNYATVNQIAQSMDKNCALPYKILKEQ